MSGFQQPITISQAIDRINRNEFLLPAFQREFVWNAPQIEKLFDSLMKGYPVSSMLFWKVRGNTKTDFKFYKFLNEYRQWYKIHNDHIPTDNLNDFYAVLDGQQRLTSIYLGLCGSFAYKEHRKYWENTERSIPTRLLYLNITTTKDENVGIDYDFKFLKREETNGADLFNKNNENWFRIGKILSLYREEYDIDDFCEDNNLTRDEKKVLKRLEKVVFYDNIINYYEEDEQQADKAVNIFIRINSGGTHLSFSDILMSVAVANWKKKDARSEIHNLVDTIRAKGFNIDKDYVLKSFLYLFNKDVRFQINSFNLEFVATIEDNWEKIRNCVISLFELMKSFGLSDYTLPAKNTTLPILYFLFHNNNFDDFHNKVANKENREIIKKWILSNLVRRTFSSQTDTILTQTRKGFTSDFQKHFIEKLNSNFPSKEINNEVKSYIDIGDDFIGNLLNTQKDTQFCFSLLALLYPNLDYKNNDFHQDHLHPASKYNDLSEGTKELISWETYNSILNLQMLGANENMSKQALDLKLWIENETENYNFENFLENHLIPNVDLTLENIVEFIEKRKVLLTVKLKELLNE